jgi:hypothetical protein
MGEELRLSVQQAIHPCDFSLIHCNASAFFSNPKIISILPPVILVRVHPNVRCDLPHLGELDHMHRRRISPFLHDRHFSAASSFQIGVSRGQRDGIERQGGSGLAAMALDL